MEKMQRLPYEKIRGKKKRGLIVDIMLWLTTKQIDTTDVSFFFDEKECVLKDGKMYIVREAAPYEYFDYYSKKHILSMSFEGELNHILNMYTPGSTKLYDEFEAVFHKHHCYFELGNAWNLSVFLFDNEPMNGWQPTLY